MRILVGIPETGSRGGTVACEPPFIEELRRAGNEVEEETYTYAQVDVGITNRIQRVLRTARRLRRRVRDGKFDLVHINSSFDTNALLRDAVIVPHLHGAGAKIFLKFHGSNAQLLDTRDPVLALSCRRLLSHADGVGVLSSEERSNFLRAGVPEQKVFQIKNVVEPYTPEGNAGFLLRWNLPEDAPRLLFISRFIQAKGLLDVIRACQLLRDRGRRFALLCIGSGPARRDAEREVQRLNLGDDVRFLGYIPEPQTAEFYTTSSMLLFPTYHYEGFPMVVFKAAAAGLPIITTRIRAAADYLHEPDNCLWVEPKNPGMLAEKISEVLESPGLQKGMAENNRSLVTRFNAQVVTQEYLKAFQLITAPGPAV